MKRGEVFKAGEIEGVVTAVRDSSIVVWDGKRLWTITHPNFINRMLYSSDGKDNGLLNRNKG